MHAKEEKHLKNKADSIENVEKTQHNQYLNRKYKSQTPNDTTRQPSLRSTEKETKNIGISYIFKITWTRSARQQNAFSFVQSFTQWMKSQRKLKQKQKEMRMKKEIKGKYWIEPPNIDLSGPWIIN